MPQLKTFYDAYHDHCPFGSCCGSNTFHARKAIRAFPDAHRVLDFGCGSGYAVREMRKRGREWFGIELSDSAFKQYLQGEQCFSVGTLDQFPDNHFDMVYSTEVFEHIPEEEIDDVLSHLSRIITKYVFLTISLRPSSSNNSFHCTLKPRAWWEQKFADHGFISDRESVQAFQQVTLQSTSEILRRWSKLGPLCHEFAENPPYELYGETQFWYFAFYKQPPKRSLFSRLYLRAKGRRFRRLLAKRNSIGLPTSNA